MNSNMTVPVPLPLLQTGSAQIRQRSQMVASLSHGIVVRLLIVVIFHNPLQMTILEPVLFSLNKAHIIYRFIAHIAFMKLSRAPFRLLRFK